MKTLLNNHIFLTICRSIPAAVFIFAGAEKIGDPAGFALSIANYRIFPDVIVNMTAIALPWIEIVAGILLLFGRYVKENALIIFTLLIVFIILIAISMARGLNIDCGCFGGIAAQKVGALKILENIILAALSYFVIAGKENEVDVEN